MAGAALVAVGVTSAPVLIVVGLVVGVGTQTGFVSFGADDWIQSKVGNLFD